MNHSKLSAVACAIHSLILSDLRVNATLATFIFAMFPSEAVLSGLHTIGVSLINMFEEMDHLYMSVMYPAVATIGDSFTSLLLAIDIIAEKIAQVFWTALEPAIAFFFPHLYGIVSTSSFMLTWSASILSKVRTQALQLISVLISKILKIRTGSQSLTFLSSLDLKTLWPISLLALFFWLSEPLGTTDDIRADYFSNVLARKCLINRDHNLACLTGIIYLLTSCTIFWNLVGANTEYSTCAAVLFCICILRPAVVKKTPTFLKIPRAVVAVTTIIQKAKTSHSRYFSDNTQQERCIKELSEELGKTKCSETALQASNRDLQRRHTTLEQTIQDLRAQLQTLKVRKDTFKKTQVRAEAFASQVKVLENELKSHRQQTAALLEAKNEMQFELELLKCTPTTSPEETSSTIEFAVPFVLVLVDGDAYEWSNLHFTQDRRSPGAGAAQAIKFEVQKYLIDHKNQIPIQSRIVVRVFQNIQAGYLKGMAHHSNFQTRYPTDFPRDFTQTMPLFDYIDSGTGKERVDSKIQECTHLFISNPSCHKIFLAATTDNGFARMLEQYAYDDAMRAKFVLVHPGYVIREIDALGLEAVEWPSVFQRKSMPETSRIKAAQIARKAAKAKVEREIASVKMMVEISPNINVFRELSRSGVSGLLQRPGKQLRVTEPNLLVVEAEDQTVIVDDEETVELDRVAHLKTAEEWKEQIMEVCNSIDQA